MEENILDIARNEHPFISDDYVLRDLTVETRKNPGLRIASFIAGFENPENGMAEKIKRLLLCDRDCCKVVSTSGKDSTNKDIIKECLSGNRGISSRGNAVQLICNMLSDKCQEIKDMAKDIVEEVFCEKNINDMITNKGPVLTYSWLLSTLILYGEDLYRRDWGPNRKRQGSNYIHNVLHSVNVLFSEENIDDVPKNKDFISSLPEVLKGMLCYVESEKRTTEIMLKLLSEKNASTVLKNEDFMSSLPGALEEMLCCTNLEEDTAEIIGRLLSKKNVNIVLKNGSFMSHLPDMIYEMLHHEGSKEKAAKVIDELFFSEEVINVMLNDERFVSGLPVIVEEMLDSSGSRDKLVGIMEELFSTKENIDMVFKNEEFVKQIPETLEKMLSNASLAGDASGIILKLLFAKNTDVVLKDENFMSHLPNMIYEMLRNEDSKENAANIMEKLFFIKENANVVLKNEDLLNHLPDTINLMLDNENLKEKAVNIVNKLLRSNATNEQLKSELNDLIACEKLLSGKDIETVLNNESFISNLPDMIYKMLRNKGLEEKAANIMEKIFSTKKNIDAVFHNEDFMSNLPDMIYGILHNKGLKEKAVKIIEDLFSYEDAISVLFKNRHFNLALIIEEMLDNRGLRDKSVWVMGKLFSTKESIDIALKNEFFISQLPKIIRQILGSEDLKEKTIDIANKILASDVINEELKSELNDLIACEKLLSGKDIETVLKNENFMSRLSDMIYEMLRNKGLEEKAANIMEKIFSTKENIGIVLKNEDFVDQLPYTFRRMLENEDLKKRTANIINKLLGSDATNEQLKSELNTIISEYGL